MSDKPILPGPGSVEPINLKDALEERYLAYALSTIMHRALPDVRDGLKPVHRRILYAMRELKLDPAAGYKKCAKIIGEVMGNFHPHGDQAIYDALVRLAQGFAVRYPLVDGQGNFGNVDGDNAAAMRYTESRLTDVAQALLEGIDEDTVAFRATYDGTSNEPVVLPAAFPNLLANGSVGIAVGMATNIPPHNAEELCNALLHLIKYPGATIDKLIEFIPGPDFPTGGVLVEPRDQIREAYKTGRGGFRLRAKWEQEDTGRGTYQIVVTEIPYQVQKAKLIERIAELLHEKKVSLLGDVRDESAEEIRVVLEPKSRSVDPLVLMESLFRLTDLEVRFGLNMNVLSAGQIPNVLSLRDVLRQWLEHRIEVLVRRSEWRLTKIEHRLEVLDGYLIAYLNLDEVIRIVRFEDDPKQKLIKRFKLTEVQADAILNLRLKSLSKLEEIAIKAEHDRLSKERRNLKQLLKSDDLQWERIAEEVRATRERYSNKTELGARRTSFAEAPEIEVDLDRAMIEKEPVTVVLSEKGWIRAMKGHVDDTSRLEFKQGDTLKRAVHASTTDKLLAFATNGRVFTLEASQLPGGRGHGEPVRLMIDLEENHDVAELFTYEPGRKLLVASTGGYGFIVPEDEVVASTRKGRQVLNVSEPDEAKVCIPVDGDQVAIIGENRKLLVFALDQINEMSRGKGMILQRFKGGGLSDV
ncbi:MAG: DNA topoisomerase IV subunit A, partial [Hyphomicrobium sp.]